MRVFHFVIKKKEKGPETGFLSFFSDSDIFLKYLNSSANHNLPSYSLFSKCFSWFSYLSVHRGTGFFSWFYFSLLLSHVTRSRARRTLASVWPKKTLKIAPVLQIQASSMKLMVHGFLFLVFFRIKTDGKNKLFFFYNHINIQIRRFFSELVESKSCGKYCLIIIRIGTNTALLAFSRSLGMKFNDY